MIKTDKYMWILLERGGLAMKRSTISILITAGLLAVFAVRLPVGRRNGGRGSGLRNERECFQASGRYGPGTGAGIKGESGNGGGRAREAGNARAAGTGSEPGAQIPGAGLLACRISCSKYRNHSIGIIRYTNWML